MQKIITKVIVIETIRSGLIPHILWRGTNHSRLTIKIWVKKNKTNKNSRKLKSSYILCYTHTSHLKLCWVNFLQSHSVITEITSTIIFKLFSSSLWLSVPPICSNSIFLFCFSINKNWSNWTIINTNVICLDSEFYLVWP